MDKAGQSVFQNLKLRIFSGLRKNLGLRKNEKKNSKNKGGSYSSESAPQYSPKVCLLYENVHRTAFHYIGGILALRKKLGLRKFPGLRIFLALRKFSGLEIFLELGDTFPKVGNFKDIAKINPKKEYLYI